MNTRKQKPGRVARTRTITASSAKRRGGRVPGSKVIDGKVVNPAALTPKLIRRTKKAIANGNGHAPTTNGTGNGNGHQMPSPIDPRARSSHIEVSSDAGKVKVDLGPARAARGLGPKR